MQDVPNKSPPQEIIQSVVEPKSLDIYREPLGFGGLEGHQSGPSLNDPSSGILKKYPAPHDRLNLDHSETPRNPQNLTVHDIAIEVPEPEALDEVAKNNLVKKGKDPYDKLVLSEEDKDYVYEIITILADNGKLSLLFKQNHLRDLGSQIDHLHPLKFLSAIFSNPNLKTRMGKIFEDYFKRNGFMDEISPSLTSKSESGELNQYIEKFAEEVKVPVEKIRPYFEEQDWNGLIDFLING